MNNNDIFKLLSKLPTWLNIIQDGNLETSAACPVLQWIAGEIWLGYCGDGKMLVLSERLTDMEELEEHINDWSKQLHGLTEFHTNAKLFSL